MNRLEGFQTETEQGIRIPCSQKDGALYIGDNFSIVSHNKDRSTSIHAHSIIIDSNVQIPHLLDEEHMTSDLYPLCPQYLALTKRGTLVSRRYYAPLYIAFGIFVYTFFRNM